MDFGTERDWTTRSGLRAVIKMVTEPSLALVGMETSWRCGYVGVPEGHPLHGVAYNAEHALFEEWSRGDLGTMMVEKRGALVLANMGFRGRARPMPDEFFDVHGCLTYSGSGDALLGKSAHSREWWFGFDCHHCDDSLARCTAEYVSEECENLAAQIVSVCQGKE